ncbi:MAG: thermonuclease family protein [Acidobacteria bacterium]|nr:thermonuclease family protein [Acidobacteriota bacterium]
MRRILLHAAGLLGALLLGTGAALWFNWRQMKSASTREPRAGDRIAGLVMRVERESLEVLPWGGRRVRVRLLGVRLWERSEALAALIDRASEQSVELRVGGLDPDGRLVAELRIRGRDLGLELLGRGLARRIQEAPGVAPEDPRSHARAERLAREAGRGLWQDGGP